MDDQLMLSVNYMWFLVLLALALFPQGSMTEGYLMLAVIATAIVARWAPDAGRECQSDGTFFERPQALYAFFGITSSIAVLLHLTIAGPLYYTGIYAATVCVVMVLVVSDIRSASARTASSS